ncbi:heme-binding protein [Mycobacterium sp.]|uniref:SOUL family heme-binding protein n=1 Tax=Mycobacterium sp. TaxID=1785 RepID=UPI002BF0C62F|nr:heme-binding protein [Mycobacterium sp.]HME47658.1 heme-binding protein [Mycobacterium sp.]
MMNPFSAALKAAKLVAESACSIVGLRWGTEEPRYSVEDRFSGVEIRHYGPRIAAETTVLADDAAARNTGFRRLAGYIFGGNHRRAQIAMTAPVAQQRTSAGDTIAMTAPVSQTRGADGGSVIRFFMPAKSTMDSLPQPNDEAVTLVEVPAETVAVLRFTGDRSPQAVADKTDALLQTLRDGAFQPAGTPLAWFYDPPFTIPFRRRNEVAVPVTPRRG